MATINLMRKLEPGTYKLKIASLDEKYGPSGYPYLTFQLLVCRGDAAGLTFSDRLSLSPMSRFRVENFLDAIKAPQKGKMDSAEFAGLKVWAEVDIEASEGYDPRPRVVKWLEPPADDTDEGDEEEESDVAEDMQQATIAELSDDEEDSSDPFALSGDVAVKSKRSR